MCSWVVLPYSNGIITITTHSSHSSFNSQVPDERFSWWKEEETSVSGRFQLNREPGQRQRLFREWDANKDTQLTAMVMIFNGI